MCRFPDSPGCYSVTYPAHGIRYNKICGQVKGYQKGTREAFLSTRYDTKSINVHSVDGLSIRLGNPRKHVWTYAVGLSDDHNDPDTNCPCAATPGPDPRAFVGDHYYCESGDTGVYHLDVYYTSDILWDGYG